MKQLKRIAFGIAVTLGCGILTITGYLAYNRATIRWHDERYRQVKIGQSDEDVVALFGQPHECIDASPIDGSYSVDRFYVYRINRFGPPVRWRFALDSSGTIVGKHRDANGC